jgi:hypothetical protein
MCYAQSATRLRKRSVAESGSHIRLSDRCPLARHRERRDIFAKGEIPGTWRNSIAIRSKVCYNKIRKAVEI